MKHKKTSLVCEVFGVESRGFEPLASRMSSERSNQLSYDSVRLTRGILTHLFCPSLKLDSHAIMFLAMISVYILAFVETCYCMIVFYLCVSHVYEYILQACYHELWSRNSLQYCLLCLCLMCCFLR